VYAWVFAVLMLSGNHRADIFPSKELCEAKRAEVVYYLSETNQTDFGFSEPPYGSVSGCIRITLEQVKRKT